MFFFCHRILLISLCNVLFFVISLSARRHDGEMQIIVNNDSTINNGALERVFLVFFLYGRVTRSLRGGETKNLRYEKTEML